MSAAAPTTTTTPLPEDLDERQGALNKLTLTALKALALKAGVTPPPSGGKPVMVAELAKSDAVMRAHGWPALDATPAASSGDVDANGDIIGGTPADPYECDEDGFPADSANVAKLDDDHLDALGGWFYTHPDFPNPPGYSQTITATLWQAPRAEKVAFIVEHGYDHEPVAPAAEVVGIELERQFVETTQDDDTSRTFEATGSVSVTPIVDDAPAHIPTAAPEPTTVTTDELARINAEANDDPTPESCSCGGKGGYAVDNGWEACTKCDGAVEDDGQLTLVPGGEAPSKSILNVAALRHDLGTSVEFKDGDRVRVTFELEVDKISFLPEKAGGESKRRMRTHAGAIDLETVEIVAV